MLEKGFKCPDTRGSSREQRLHPSGTKSADLLIAPNSPIGECVSFGRLLSATYPFQEGGKIKGCIKSTDEGGNPLYPRPRLQEVLNLEMSSVCLGVLISLR